MRIIRELDKESLLNCYSIDISYKWSMLTLIQPYLKVHMLSLILISSIRLPYHIYILWCYFSSLFSQSLGLWSHIMWCVMWPQSHASSSSENKNKNKKNKKKPNIKSRKINKRKKKKVSVQVYHNRSWNTDQPKNMKEKSLRRASFLTDCNLYECYNLSSWVKITNCGLYAYYN